MNKPILETRSQGLYDGIQMKKNLVRGRCAIEGFKMRFNIGTQTNCREIVEKYKYVLIFDFHFFVRTQGDVSCFVVILWEFTTSKRLYPAYELQEDCVSELIHIWCAPFTHLQTINDATKKKLKRRSEREGENQTWNKSVLLSSNLCYDGFVGELKWWIKTYFVRALSNFFCLLWRKENFNSYSFNVF